MFMSKDAYHGDEVAIIGMTGRFPGARNIEEFWQNLRNGVETISFFSDKELMQSGIGEQWLHSSNYIRAKGVISDIELFDATFFGISPKEAALLDPQQRLFLECAWEALESAGYNSETYQNKIGVFAGTGMNTYIYNIHTHNRISKTWDNFEVMITNDKDFISTRAAYKLNLKGPGITVQTACSTSLVAVHLACQSVLNGECVLALAGGVSIMLPQKTGYVYKQDGILSPDGHCRTFDAKGQGTVSSNGIGIVVLKRLEEAIADGDYIHAVIKGSAINNDGALKMGYTAPSVQGQAEVIGETLAMARVAPETISYIEAHGTGTAIGDPIEIVALTKVYGAASTKKQFCAIGSVKSNIGHLDVAAGIAGLIKTVQALKYREVPPSLHFTEPNPQIDFANSPFFVNTTLATWNSTSGPRRAGVSSFGIGGTNAHIILEEAPPVLVDTTHYSWHLLVLSAKTKDALLQIQVQLAAYLKKEPNISLADVAYTLQIGRRAFSHRSALLCRDLQGAISALENGETKETLGMEEVFYVPQVVFLFPGQGTQYIQMGCEIYKKVLIFRTLVDRCAELLLPILGMDIRTVLYPDSEQAEEARKLLEQTWVTQPALFVVEYALACCLMNWGLQPDAMLGHSIGEYVAACLAGVFTLEDALVLVAQRGRLMQALPTGAMIAVALSEHDVRPWIRDGVSLAAINSQQQCVLSGPEPIIEELMEKLQDQGIDCHQLQTSHAFHSSMMEPMLEAFANEVRKISLHPPKLPYVSNITGDWVTEEMAMDDRYWVDHVIKPVHFFKGLKVINRKKEMVVLEVGPGQTLGALLRFHMGAKALESVFASLPRAERQQEDLAFLLKTVGQLWLKGVEIDWPKIHMQNHRLRVPLPTYPFERQRYWIDPLRQEDKEDTGYEKLRKNSDIGRWLYEPSWKRIAPVALSSISTEKLSWLVFVDMNDIGEKIAVSLSQMGHSVIVVRAGSTFSKASNRLYTINPLSISDYTTILVDLYASKLAPKRVVHLWSLTESSDSTKAGNDEDFNRIQEFGFFSLLLFIQAQGKLNVNQAMHIDVVSNGIHDVTGDEPLCPAKATLLALCKVISQEYTSITCRNIDMVLPQQNDTKKQKIIEVLLAELIGHQQASIIAYRGNYRWTQTFEVTTNKGEGQIRLRQEGVYMITGGLGNIGMVLAEYLGQAFKARLILIGRSMFPSKEEWENWLVNHEEHNHISQKIRKLQAIIDVGGEVVVFSADVADLEQMQTVLEQVCNLFGTIHGVIHAAVKSDGMHMKLIQEEDISSCQEQFRPKIHGLLTLEKILQGRNLDFCVLLSSLSSILGGLGLTSYAAANSFIDAFVRKVNRSSLGLWTSINYDTWIFKAAREDNVVSDINSMPLALSPDEGIELFRRILTNKPIFQVIVSAMDLSNRLKPLVDHNTEMWLARQVQDTALLYPRTKVPTSYIAPRNEVEQIIATIWQHVLGIEKIGIHDDFFELGGDSLLLLHISTELEEAFHLNIPLKGLRLNASTIEDIATLVLAKR